MNKHVFAAALSSVMGFMLPAFADVPNPTDTPYSGTIKIAVDATNLAHRIFKINETIPVNAGEMTLLYSLIPI